MLLKLNCVVCIFLLVMCETNSSNILGLFTSQHKSHMMVYMGVIKSLHNRGHNITIVTVLAIQDQLPSNLRVIQINKPPVAESRFGIFRQIAVVAANSRVLEDPRFQRFLNEDNNFDLLIIGYLFNDYQLGVGAHFNCPIVVIWTTQPISFVNRFIGNPNEWSYVPDPFVRTQAVGFKGVLHGIFNTIFQWIIDFAMDEVYRKQFPPSKYPTLKQMQRNVSLVLCNHHFSEGPIAAYLPGIIEISGIQIQNNKRRLHKALERFMDSASNGVIYFSLGTLVSPKQLGKTALNIFLKVFSSIPQKVIWKTESLSGSSVNIFTGKWFPQSSILAHSNTKLFITHGGKGSTIEALYYAVPMVAIPFFGDQFGDARRIEKNGFGITLHNDNITERSLRDCIFQVLNNNYYSDRIKNASKIYRDRPLSPEKSATYWIEYVIRHRGALHMQTPANQTNIIKYFNIDIYLYCVCFVYAVIVAIKLVSLHYLII